MSKYKVYLADNWKRTEPFTTDWDYELIGDKLRAEFDVYFAEQEKLANAGGGKTRQLFKGEYVKKFMITKRVNLVDDPATGNLKSVFVLKTDEKKLIDGRAKESLGPRFEFRQKTNKEGVLLEPEGFLKFDLIEADANVVAKQGSSLQIGGNDIEYFEEQPQPEVEEVKEAFVCDVCQKEFATARSLQGHKLSHSKAK